MPFTLMFLSLLQYSLFGELLPFAAERHALPAQAPSDPTLDNWVPLIHPEGALYWVNAKEVSPAPDVRTPF